MQLRKISVALICFAIFALLFYVSIQTKTGQILDFAMLYGQIDKGNSFYTLSNLILVNTTEIFVIITLVLTAIIGLAKRKYRAVATVFVAVLVSNLATQLLKHQILQRPYLEVLHKASNSFPSGHVTVVASSIIALMLIVPFAYRKLFSYLAIFFIFSCAVFVCVAQWHRLSDAIGAIVLTTGIFMLSLFISGFFSGSEQSLPKVNDTKKSVNYLWIFSACFILAWVSLIAIYVNNIDVLQEFSTNQREFITLASTFRIAFLSTVAKISSLLGTTVLCVKALQDSTV